MSKALSSRQMIFWSCLVFFVALMAPGIDWFDSPELAQAAFFLDSTHPPGQPLYVMLAKFVSFLPFGSIAWRLNLFSALCCAAAVTLLMQLIPTTLKGAPRFGIMFVLLLQPALVLQAVRAEVYGLHLLLATACIVLTEKFLGPDREDKKDWRYGLLVSAFFFGLGLTNHHFLMLLLSPYLLLRFYLANRYAGASLALIFNRLLWVFPFIIIGLGLYLFLPLRASVAQLPPLTWGEPNTWQQLWRFLRGEDFNVFFVLPWQDAQPMLRALQGIGWWLISAALLAVALTRQRLPLLLCLATAFVGCTVTVFYTENPDSFGYIALIPMLLVVLIAEGISRLRSLAWQLMATGICLLLALWQFLEFPHPMLRAQHYLTQSYVETIEQNAPPQALFIVTSDHAIFPLLFSQYVEHGRDDLIYVGSNVFGASWYRRALQRQHPDLLIPMQPGTQLSDLVKANRQRPVFAERIDELVTIAKNLQLPLNSIRPWGNWFYLQQQTGQPSPVFSKNYFFNEFNQHQPRYAMTGSQIAAFIKIEQAKYFTQIEGDLLAAIRAMEAAVGVPAVDLGRTNRQLSPLTSQPPLNLPIEPGRYRDFINDRSNNLVLLGQYYMAAGVNAEAVFLQANQLGNANGMIILADTALKAKHPAIALGYLQQIKNNSPQKNLALGIVNLHIPNLAAAEAHLLRAVQQLPHDPGALIWLAWLRWQQGNVDAAANGFAEAVRRFPDNPQVLLQQQQFTDMQDDIKTRK